MCNLGYKRAGKPAIQRRLSETEAAVSQAQGSGSLGPHIIELYIGLYYDFCASYTQCVAGR